MGAIAELRIGEIVFDSWKNGVPPEIAILFSEREKQVETIPFPTELEDALEDGESSPLREVKYITSVNSLKSRLEFFGFTMNVSREVFEIARAKGVEDCKRSISLWGGRSVIDEEARNQIIKREEEKIQILTCTNPDQWLETLRKQFQNPEAVNSYQIAVAGSISPPAIGNGMEMRFPGDLDLRFRLRYELEATQKGDAVLDISDLVNGGYYDASDSIPKYAFDELTAQERVVSHLIVLTEGSSDRFYLESAFRLFHPELTEYVSFMDFDSWNVPGGASFLENMVRSFAAAGIRDRILALFDNDTAGSASLFRLSQVQLPKNIRAMQYPDVEIAKNYPTLGPSGAVIMDVNGAAASIELYLGSDVIKTKDATYIPVQWKGYDQALRRYQGEIVDKRGCRKRFEEKLSSAIQSQSGPDEAHWAELKAILDLIRTAFTPLDSSELINGASAP